MRSSIAQRAPAMRTRVGRSIPAGAERTRGRSGQSGSAVPAAELIARLRPAGESHARPVRDKRAFQTVTSAQTLPRLSRNVCPNLRRPHLARPPPWTIHPERFATPDGQNKWLIALFQPESQAPLASIDLVTGDSRRWNASVQCPFQHPPRKRRFRHRPHIGRHSGLLTARSIVCPTFRQAQLRSRKARPRSRAVAYTRMTPTRQSSILPTIPQYCC